MKNGSHLDEIGAGLEDLSTEYSRLGWVRYTTGFDFGVNDAYEKIAAFMKDGQRWAVICRALETHADPVLQRKAEILHRAFMPFHLSEEANALSTKMQELTNRLSGVLNSYRFSVLGKQMTSPDIEKLLSSEHDRELRRKAFLSRAQISGALADEGFTQLLEMRREYAEMMGEDSFTAYSLDQQELGRDLFGQWPEELRDVLPLLEKTRGEYAAKYLRSDRIMPWDEAFIASSIAPELNAPVDMSSCLEPIAELFARFGFDIRTMNITYDIFPRRHKSEWGYNFPIRKGVDSRILANVRNRFSDFRVLLHETGHAAHSFAMDPGEKVLNMGISGIVSEGIANLFGSFRTRKVFYEEVLGKDAQEAQLHFSELDRWNRASQFTALGRILFDAALYTENPRTLQEIEELRWETDRKLFGIEPYADHPVWAHTIHHTTHPVYLHNYLLGDLTCDMLETAFRSREGVGSITDAPEAFGEFLRSEVIAPSGMYSFPDLFRRISGRELSLSCMAERIREELE